MGTDRVIDLSRSFPNHEDKTKKNNLLGQKRKQHTTLEKKK